MKAFIEVMYSIKGYVWFMTFLLVLGIFVGYTFAEPFHFFLAKQLEGLKGLKQVIEKQDNPTFALFILIFANNTAKSILVILTGFVFGILPLFMIILNGLLVGFLLNVSSINPFKLFFAGILPHGILELPAIVIATALGLKFGSIFFQWFYQLISGGALTEVKNDFRFYKKRLLKTIGVLTMILLVAAIVESLITPILIKAFIHI